MYLSILKYQSLSLYIYMYAHVSKSACDAMMSSSEKESSNRVQSLNEGVCFPPLHANV